MKQKNSLKKRYLIIFPLLTVFALITASCTLFSEDADRQTPTSPPPPSDESPLEGIDIEYTYTSELITVIYPLYGEILNDYLIIQITNQNSEPIRLIISSEIQGYSHTTTDTVDIPGGGSVEVRQNPLLIPETIDQLNTEKPAQFHIQATYLEDGQEKMVLDQTHETVVYGRRDFPWAIEGFTDEEVFELTASMVMPNEPAVEVLIRAAAEYTSSGIMTNGYSSVGDEDGRLWERLEAIWQAESQDYDLTYINTWVSYAPGDVQRIRLPSEVLDDRSGNCIELALLFSSAAEALDLETALLRVPGHAFMGVRMDQQNANYYFIETTLIGRVDFETAVQKGMEGFEQALPKISEHEDYYDWITVKDARAKGIMPLPWH